MIFDGYHAITNYSKHLPIYENADAKENGGKRNYKVEYEIFVGEEKIFRGDKWECAGFLRCSEKRIVKASSSGKRVLGQYFVGKGERVKLDEQH